MRWKVLLSWQTWLYLMIFLFFGVFLFAAGVLFAIGTFSYIIYILCEVIYLVTNGQYHLIGFWFIMNGLMKLTIGGCIAFVGIMVGSSIIKGEYEAFKNESEKRKIRRT